MWHMSHVTLKKNYKVLELLGGESAINGATPSSFPLASFQFFLPCVLEAEMHISHWPTFSRTSQTVGRSPLFFYFFIVWYPRKLSGVLQWTKASQQWTGDVKPIQQLQYSPSRGCQWGTHRNISSLNKKIGTFCFLLCRYRDIYIHRSGDSCVTHWWVDKRLKIWWGSPIGSRPSPW